MSNSVIAHNIIVFFFQFSVCPNLTQFVTLLARKHCDMWTDSYLEESWFEKIIICWTECYSKNCQIVNISRNTKVLLGSMFENEHVRKRAGAEPVCELYHQKHCTIELICFVICRHVLVFRLVLTFTSVVFMIKIRTFKIGRTHTIFILFINTNLKF